MSPIPQRSFIVWLVLVLLFSNTIYAQIDADFSANNLSLCGSGVVNFTDESTSSNPIVSWDWDLQLITSNLQNPGLTFPNPGSYTICLTITDDLGNTDTECQDDYIIVHALPQPDFSGLAIIGCSPLSVQFTDNSIPSSTGNIVDWFWSFGDGSTSTLQNPEHTFINPGTYDIILTITDDNGCSDFFRIDEYISVEDFPTADFIADGNANCSAPFGVNFTNNSTPNGELSYEWDFGDGSSTSSLENPSHNYLTEGSFDVTLIITNLNSGCQDTLVQSNFIQVGTSSGLSYNAPNSCSPLSVQFNDLSSGTPSAWAWDFGDGIGSSTLQNPNYTYTTPGCYTVSLSVTIDACVLNSTSDTCIVVADVPTASYSSSTLSNCQIPHTVSFTGNSNDPTAIYNWDFGGAGNSNLQNPDFTFTSYGTYPISLTVSNQYGCETTIIQDTVTLEEINLNFNSDVTNGCIPLAVNFIDNSSSMVPIVNWEWNVGGNIASGPNPTIVFPDTGSFDLNLVIEDANGCTDTLFIPEYINAGMPPSSNFTADPTIVCLDSIVYFSNTSSPYADQFFWDFGDGTTSNEANPEHPYSDIGTFDVMLVSAHNGCRDTLILTDYITVNPPLADFSVTQNCDDPYTIQLVDQSIGADTWSWDFGDTNIDTDTSSLAAPSYTFASTGTYTIRLTVTNLATGCDHSNPITITIADPIADFTIDNNIGCAPFTVQTNNNSQDALSQQWSAPGGNITNSTAIAPNITYTDAGYYNNIQLVITDVNACSDTLVYTDTITVNDVFPGFDTDVLTGCAPLSVNFTDTSSSFIGNIVSWDWDLDGDGVTDSNDQHPSFVYTNTGSYDISLTITNEQGCTRTLNQNNFITPTYPDVAFSADDFVCTNQAVSFTNNSLGSSLNYLWDFGDGNTSTANNPSHNYSSEGIFTICLTATDINGCDSTLCMPDLVTVGNPQALFTADTTFASCPPLIVNFSDLSLNTVAWEWDFGDSGAGSNLQNPSYVYTEPGSYDVCLIATSISGCMDTLCIQDYITIGGPSAFFSFDMDEGCAPLSVNFEATGTNVSTYIWDFGNGDIVSHVNSDVTDNITYNYTEAGTFYPILTIIDNQGCQRTYTSPDPITVESLEIDFVSLETTFCESGAITFYSLPVSSAGVNSIEWIFPGGSPNFSSAPSPTVNYSSTEDYNVTLIVNSNFCSDTLTKAQYITIAPNPVADFSTNTSQGCEDLSVQFIDNSSIAVGSIASYLWNFGDGAIDSIPNPNHTYTSPGIYTAQLTVISDNGCTNSNTIDIEVLPVPTADAGLGGFICINQSIQLNASGSGSLSWSPANTLSCSDCPNPIANPITTTTYTLTVSAVNGCTTTSQVTVEVSPFTAPVLSLTQDTSICLGDFVQLQAGGGSSIYDYQWDPSIAGLSCYSNCYNPIAQPTVSTTYYVTLTGQGSCQTTDSVRVNVIDESMDLLGPDLYVCAGDSIQLNIPLGSNPVWSPPLELSCINCPNPIAFPTETRTYSVEINSPGNNCSISDEITIHVSDPAIISAGEDQVFCLGASVQLEGSAPEGASIIWSPATDMDDPTILNPMVTPSGTSTYYLSLNNSSCEIIDSVVIRMISGTQIDGEDVEVCFGEDAQLEVNGNADEYLWEPSLGLSNTTITNPISSSEESIVYKVIGIKNGCPSDTIQINLTVHPLPDIILAEQKTYFEGQTIELEADVSNVSNPIFNWYPDENISCIDCPNPSLQPEGNVSYTLEVISPKACVNTAVINLIENSECSDDLIVVPNAFTPNNDGRNDLLYVRGSTLNKITIFRIFNRWGELVFESNNINEGWDGNYKGKPLNSGVFVYYVEAPCIKDGSTIMKKGNITLIR